MAVLHCAFVMVATNIKRVYTKLVKLKARGKKTVVYSPFDITQQILQSETLVLTWGSTRTAGSIDSFPWQNSRHKGPWVN